MTTSSPHPPQRRDHRHDSLLRLGWDDAWSAAFADHLAGLSDADPKTHRTPGRVCRADLRADEVLVPTDHGLTRLTAEWHPRIERMVAEDPGTVPTAGDWVVVADVARARTAHLVEAVLPRRAAVVRAQVGGSSHGQVLAANCDVAAVVEGVVPNLDPTRIERLLALAWSSGARPVVVLTKADLVEDPAHVVTRVASLAPGVEVCAVASPQGAGLDGLRQWLAGGATIALLGASGAGKSTLLNALVADDAGAGPMVTRSLSARDEGRHTTVTRELHLGPQGGAVLDTPGLRTVGVVDGTGLGDVFGDVDDLAAQCRFSDCAHRTEPGCAVLAAIAAGDLPERRLASYRALRREAVRQAARTDGRLRAELNQRWRAAARARRRGPAPR